MSRRDKAIINQLLYRIADLEDAVEERDTLLALWETGEIQHEVPDLTEFWGKIKGRKQ